MLALQACGVGPGDEVITVAHTFTATAEAIVLLGATPVFVDVEPQTLTLDPQRVERAVKATTKAIVPVHLYGQPADMGKKTFANFKGISKITSKYKLHPHVTSE